MSSNQPILIAGAGIAGLAAAVGLAQAGLCVRLFDRRTVLSEAGAGIQIGPNGVKALAALGLRETVQAASFQPQGLAIRQGASGKLLAELPWGEVAQKRYGAPYLSLLRTELQAVLLAAVKSNSRIELTLGFDLAGIAEEPGGVTVTAEDGRKLQGAALVGADGLWSRARREISPAEPQSTGYIAYRAVIERAGLAAPFDAPGVGLWMSREAHVVHYPVMGGQRLNLVVVVGSPRRTHDWDDPGQLADIAPYLAYWPENLCNLLENAPSWRRWTLYELPALSRWSRGRLVLIGDAAHPVLPFFAQGAVMALEDAVLLPALIGAHGATSVAYEAFERLRRARVERLAAASWANGRTYHMGGLGAAARDAVLRLSPPERLLRRFDWLYGYDPAVAAAPPKQHVRGGP